MKKSFLHHQGVEPQKTVTLETFQFETAQIKKVSRQAVELRAVKKLSWFGYKEVVEDHTKTIEEWHIHKESGQAKRFTEELGNGKKLEMVEIPGGEFMMGAPETEESSSDSLSFG
jgi:formylglycine-generating enzyme required for sulfatase activity